jgi:transposase-like protein
VGRPDFPRSIVDFQEHFPDDAACLDYLAASRWPEGFRCPACGCERAWVLERRHLWECVACRHQASVTAGTVMHGTRTSPRLWFWAAYLVATHTPGISAVQLQRQLGISRYETAWLILQKLRRAMVAPEREPLRGEVEVDETLVGGVREGRHVARRHGEKALVGVIVEVRGSGSGRLRLQVLPDASGDTLISWLCELVAAGAIVHTDGWRGYSGLAGVGYEHRPRLQPREHPDAQKLLPRAHRVASNLKTWLQGTHHGVSAEHLQVYLDEFVFRHNRRRTPMAAFQTLLGLGALHEPTTYREITRREQAAA